MEGWLFIHLTFAVLGLETARTSQLCIRTYSWIALYKWWWVLSSLLEYSVGERFQLKLLNSRAYHNHFGRFLPRKHLPLFADVDSKNPCYATPCLMHLLSKQSLLPAPPAISEMQSIQFRLQNYLSRNEMMTSPYKQPTIVLYTFPPHKQRKYQLLLKILAAIITNITLN